MNTLLVMGIAHVIGDYLFQPDKLVKAKKEKRWGLPVHSLIYAATVLLTLLWCVGWNSSWLPLLIIAVSHGMIDFARVETEKKWASPKINFISFCIDQCLHLVIIFACWKVFIRYAPMSVYYSSLCDLSWFRTALIYTGMLAVIWDPASVFIKKVFGLFPKMGKQDEKDDSYTKAGDLIGKLERLIVVALVLSDAASSIGFVLTAKSIARYNQIADNKGFAERYLIGTLLSVSVALVTVFLGSKLMP